jgi:small subunit ribosomal protein S21
LRRNKFNSNRNYNSPKTEGLVVTVRNDDVNGAIRRFKKKVAESGVIQDFRDKQFYVKPSEKKRKAKAAGRARWLKKQAKDLRERGF